MKKSKKVDLALPAIRKLRSIEKSITFSLVFAMNKSQS